MSDRSKPKVSPCGRYHVTADGSRYYAAAEFDSVLPFHKTSRGWLAPVGRDGRAWHIDETGAPAHEGRYDQCFGFYEDRAAVRDGQVWLHILPDGAPLYRERYGFAGNFQEGRCVVCTASGRYVHINADGAPSYCGHWRYCGDFREGYAVVQRDDGKHSHIDMHGHMLHDQWFDDLDVFHKRAARARLPDGWAHVSIDGQPLYPARYRMIEPFYNGCARVETVAGALQVIDTHGRTLRELRPAQHDSFHELSADLVGYWRTLAISTAVELGIFDNLPGSDDDLAQKLDTQSLLTKRLLRGLGELGLTELRGGIWHSTHKGTHLSSNNPQSLAPAAREYAGDLLERWRALGSIVAGSTPRQDIFQTVSQDDIRRKAHHAMLRAYALHDYPPVIAHLGIEPSETVLDAGGGDGALCQLIVQAHPDAKVILADLPEIISQNHADTFERLGFDLFKPWNVKADKIILARVLHDWDDAQCIEILKHARNALRPRGTINIIEHLAAEGSFHGGLCDLHLLSASGGKQRTLRDFAGLLDAAGLYPVCTPREFAAVTLLKAQPS